MSDKQRLVKTKVLDTFTLILDPEDGTPEDKWPKWKLCYDYRAIARVEEATGLDLRNVETWNQQKVTSKQWPQIVWGGLAKFNREVTLEQVLDALNPEAQFRLERVVMFLLFPWLEEAVEKEEKARAASGGAPTESPNVRRVTTTK